MMRGVKLLIALLSASALMLGTGYAFAQQAPSITTTPSTSTTPPATSSSSPAAPVKPAATQPPSGKKAAAKSEETRETKGQQQREARATKEERGEKEMAPDRVVRGSVTAVDTAATPNTLVMQAELGKQPATIGVDVPATTKIIEGKAKKSLTDIKPGDHVWMRYDRLSDRLVAEQIRILPPGSRMAKAQKGEKSPKATPAAAQDHTSKKSY